MDDIRWQSLNQRLGAISDLNSELEDLVHLALQLALQLESDSVSIKTGTSYSQEKDLSLNRNEELSV